MSQSLSQMWVHIIFSTKDRYPFLKNPTVLQKVHHYIQAICHQQNCTPAFIGGIENHVHILLNMHKSLTLTKLIEEIKKSSSKWIKTLDMLDHDLTRFYWQRGYGAFSVSQSSVENVKRYIANQQDHHKTRNFQDELRKFLIQHGVDYKEEFVWD